MLLRCYEFYDQLAQYDPVTKTLSTFSQSAEPARASTEPCGAFDYIGGKLLLVYWLHRLLYLEVDSQRTRFQDLAIELMPQNGQRLLRVLSNGRLVVELSYDPPVLDPPLSEDPTPFVEEEDFDFALFLANLSRDPARQTQVYGGGQRGQE